MSDLNNLNMVMIYCFEVWELYKIVIIKKFRIRAKIKRQKLIDERSKLENVSISGILC